MRVTHQWTDDRARVRVEGLRNTVRALHVADTHLGLIDDRDADFLDTCRDLAARFRKRHDNRDSEGRIVPQEAAFEQILLAARRQRADLLALGGDIVDFPALSGIERVRGLVEENGIPALSTPGNHDWQFLGQEPCDRVRRACAGRMEMLHGAPDFDRREVGGLLFLAVDNSTYQIGEEQLERTRRTLAEGVPTVLLIHVPLSLPTLRGPVIDTMKGEPVLLADPDWPESSRAVYGAGPDSAETLEFVRLVSRAQNLVAILAGHLHHPHVDSLNPWAAQYVAPPGYAGQFRLMQWEPL